MSRRGRNVPPITLFSFQDIVTSVVAVVVLVTLLLTLELIHRRLSPSPEGAAASIAALREAIRQAEGEARDVQSRLGKKASWLDELARSSPDELARDNAVVERQIESLTFEVDLLMHHRTRIGEEESRLQAEDWKREGDGRKLVELQTRARSLRRQLEEVRRQDSLAYNPAPGTSKKAWLVDLSAERFAALPLGHTAAKVEFAERSISSRVSAFARWAAGRNPHQEYFVLLVRPAVIQSFGQLRTVLEKMGFEIGFDLLGAGQKVTAPSPEGTAS